MTGAQPTGLMVHQWAWEFLRRNGEYIALMEAYGSGPFFCRHGEREFDVQEMQAFWMFAPIHPSVPGEFFQAEFWHFGLVPVALGTSCPVFHGAGESLTVQMARAEFLVSPTLTREDQHRLLDDELDRVGAPSMPSRGRPPLFSNFPKYLRAYDLWKACHVTQGGGMTWEAIGRELEPMLPAYTLAQKARDYQNAAVDLINGGYKTLLRGDVRADTGVKPVPPPVDFIDLINQHFHGGENPS